MDRSHHHPCRGNRGDGVVFAGRHCKPKERVELGTRARRRQPHNTRCDTPSIGSKQLARAGAWSRQCVLLQRGLRAA